MANARADHRGLAPNWGSHDVGREGTLALVHIYVPSRVRLKQRVFLLDPIAPSGQRFIYYHVARHRPREIGINFGFCLSREACAAYFKPNGPGGRLASPAYKRRVAQSAKAPAPATVVVVTFREFQRPGRLF